MRCSAPFAPGRPARKRPPQPARRATLRRPAHSSRCSFRPPTARKRRLPCLPPVPTSGLLRLCPPVVCSEKNLEDKGRAVGRNGRICPHRHQSHPSGPAWMPEWPRSLPSLQHVVPGRPPPIGGGEAAH
ncbi:MAG: hypothetical protein D6775_16765 [Caldilineae bacterium]|nr:MAG: hypothetical protein D6775_16765 [Caldilineae bacterium]